MKRRQFLADDRDHPKSLEMDAFEKQRATSLKQKGYEPRYDRRTDLYSYQDGAPVLPTSEEARKALKSLGGLIGIGLGLGAAIVPAGAATAASLIAMPFIGMVAGNIGLPIVCGVAKTAAETSETVISKTTFSIDRTIDLISQNFSQRTNGNISLTSKLGLFGGIALAAASLATGGLGFPIAGAAMLGLATAAPSVGILTGIAKSVYQNVHDRLAGIEPPISVQQGRAFEQETNAQLRVMEAERDFLLNNKDATPESVLGEDYKNLPGKDKIRVLESVWDDAATKEVLDPTSSFARAIRVMKSLQPVQPRLTAQPAGL